MESLWMGCNMSQKHGLNQWVSGEMEERPRDAGSDLRFARNRRNGDERGAYALFPLTGRHSIYTVCGG